MNSGAELTNAEWRVMDCLWENSPQTTMQIAAALRESAGWAKSTTLTMLRRMAEKGLLRCDESGEGRAYEPLVAREDAVRRETESFLHRVYKGSVSLLVSEITSKQDLSDEEIEELYAILDRAKEAGK